MITDKKTSMSSVRATTRPIVWEDVSARHGGAPLPADDEWAVHKQTIRRLYLDENMTLKQVVDTMKKDYGFSATIKTYKSRMRAWGYRKNITLEDGQAEHISRVLQKQPWSSNGIVRLEHGGVVSLDRLAMHLRRRRHHAETGRGRLVSPTTQSIMSANIKAPDVYYIPEAVVKCVSDYHQGRWGPQISTVEQLNITRDEHSKYTQLNLLGHGIQRALQQKKLSYALVLMRQAPEVIRMLIQVQPIPFIANFFMFLSWIINGFLQLPDAEQFTKVIKSLIQYVATSAVQGADLPQGHPLRQMLTMLMKAEPRDLTAIAQQALRINCESLDALIPGSRKSHYNFATWIVYGREVGFLNLPPSLGKNMEQTLKEYKETYGVRHAWTEHMTQLYAWYLHYTDSAKGRNPYKNDKIMILFEDLLQGQPKLRADVLEWLAAAAEARDQRETAERYMRELIEIEIDHPLRRAVLVTDILKLEGWLTKWGEDEKAAELARWRTEKFNV
ncbi:hypothetical protein M406DRAFT_108438 [Cryphonectria parasitica EP155]|uniref:Clr5 domain-containing protein n=1 Tax=Cryphonectria parasitica (strain ATCC 38755 / EP155) TaxID=660469 RepID=A0A9P4XY88_CRYP1|nr:uncharacterized protein M406DRAFT_108438 [Cryphonectria parasitica EP155]KAF3762987.1 hypothetical protein M406DRAFT_108438 [Cryphonectria parasitica EP155]